MKVSVYTRFGKDYGKDGAIVADVQFDSMDNVANYLTNNEDGWLPTDKSVIRIRDIINITKFE